MPFEGGVLIKTGVCETTSEASPQSLPAYRHGPQPAQGPTAANLRLATAKPNAPGAPVDHLGIRLTHCLAGYKRGCFVNLESPVLRFIRDGTHDEVEISSVMLAGVKYSTINNFL